MDASVLFWATLVTIIVRSQGIKCFQHNQPIGINEKPYIRIDCDTQKRSEGDGNGNGNGNEHRGSSADQQFQVYVDTNLSRLNRLSQEPNGNGPPPRAGPSAYDKCISVRFDFDEVAAYACGNGVYDGCRKDVRAKDKNGNIVLASYACLCCADFCNDGSFSGDSKCDGFLVKPDAKMIAMMIWVASFVVLCY